MATMVGVLAVAAATACTALTDTEGLAPDYHPRSASPSTDASTSNNLEPSGATNPESPNSGIVGADASVTATTPTTPTTPTGGADASTSSSDASTGSLGDGSTSPLDGGAMTTECPMLLGGDPCTSIPSFVGSQNVDGVGDEFCGIPAAKLVLTDGYAKYPQPTPADVATVVYARVAWSSYGLHMHVRVEQPTIAVAVNDAALYLGDAFEWFASNDDNLLGPFGKSPFTGAQIIGAPPAAGYPTRAMQHDSDGTALGLLPDSEVAGRVVSGAYELEFRVPWSTLGGAAPAAGARIGFDMGADAHLSNGPTSEFQSFYALASSMASNCSGTAVPYCDDRSWCSTRLR